MTDNSVFVYPVGSTHLEGESGRQKMRLHPEVVLAERRCRRVQEAHAAPVFRGGGRRWSRGGRWQVSGSRFQMGGQRLGIGSHRVAAANFLRLWRLLAVERSSPLVLLDGTGLPYSGRWTRCAVRLTCLGLQFILHNSSLPAEPAAVPSKTRPPATADGVRPGAAPKSPFLMARHAPGGLLAAKRTRDPKPTQKIAK